MFVSAFTTDQSPAIPTDVVGTLATTAGTGAWAFAICTLVGFICFLIAFVTIVILTRNSPAQADILRSFGTAVRAYRQGFRNLERPKKEDEGG